MIALLLGLLAGAGDLVDGVACIVNDEVITFSEVYDVSGDFVPRKCGVVAPGVSTPCTDAAELEIVETLIMQALVRQKLSEVDMDVSDEDLDRTIDQIMRDNDISTREQFRAALLQQGYSWDIYRDQLRDQVRMLRFRETFLRPAIRITSDEVRDAYQRAVREAGAVGEDQLSITYLLYPLPQGVTDEVALSLKAGLMEAVAGLTDGQGFDTLGAVEGIEPRRASSTYMPSQLVTELRPILELDKGDVGGPYLIGGGFFVVRLDDRVSTAPPSLEEVRDKIEAQLFEQRLTEEAEQWYQHARRGAAVRCTMQASEAGSAPAGPDAG